MGTKSFVQIEINAVFTTTSGKMQFRSGVFDHFKSGWARQVLLTSANQFLVMGETNHTVTDYFGIRTSNLSVTNPTRQCTIPRPKVFILC
jgi:hypothetical protein